MLKTSKMTYNVPTTLLVLASSWLLPKILAVPKYEIFALISSSNKTLLAFKSLWMILRRDSSWRYRIHLDILIFHKQWLLGYPSLVPYILLDLSGRRFFIFLFIFYLRKKKGKKKNPVTILKVIVERQLILKCNLTVNSLRIGTRFNLVQPKLDN